LDTEEWIDGSLAGKLGEVLIRCNNVLFIRGVESLGASKKRKVNEDEQGDKN